MGSTSFNADLSRKTADIIADDLNGEYEVIASACKGGACYMAIRSRADHDHVEAAVVLYRRTPASLYNFWTKWMSEDMGPYYFDCPERILKLLSPATTPAAQEWRDKCRARLAKVAEAKRVQPGDTIVLDEPLEFSDHVKRDTFRFIKGSQFVAEDGVRVSLSNWRTRAFRIVEPVAA